MGDVVLFVDDLQSSCAVSHCRICHEAEFESCKSLEAPCACSGTVKVELWMFSSVLFCSCGWCLSVSTFISVNNSFLSFPNWVSSFSLLTETAYRDGVTRRGIQLVKYVYRYEFAGYGCAWSINLHLGFPVLYRVRYFSYYSSIWLCLL